MRLSQLVWISALVTSTSSSTIASALTMPQELPLDTLAAHANSYSSANGIQVERRNMHYRLFHWGSQVDAMVITARAAELLACMPVKSPPDLSKFLLSPMPGLLSQLLVADGDEVESGQDLAVIEAMKMENVLRAERNGKVTKTLAAVGDTLSVDQSILEFE